jgi:hypothetical protein
MEDRAGRDGSRIALGQTESGRYLRVIYVPASVDTQNRQLIDTSKPAIS